MCFQLNRFLLFLLSSAALLIAQSEKATLRGTVTDAAGNPLSNVTVVLTAAGSEVVLREVATSADGKYQILYLRPGLCRVSISQEGFADFVAEKILLDPGQVRRLDPKLTAKESTGAAAVPETAAPIQSESGTVSDPIDYRARWNDAPFVDLHPSVLPLLTTAPAIQGNNLGLVMSGISSRDQQTWALDGVPQDTTTQSGNPAFFETVEVTIANPGVDASRAVHFNMVSKHGSDDFHGFVYYKRGSSAFDARSYFDTRKTTYKLSEVAGELGGPLIPHWTHFYGGGMYQKVPYSQTLYADVPTAPMRLLDLGQYLNPQTAPNGKVVVARDPKNGVPFANNQIPSSRLNAVASNYLKNYYPSPNVGDANTFTQNYTWNHPYGPEAYIGNWPFGRVDQKVSAQNQAYVRWMQNQTASIATGSVGEQLNATRTVRYRGLVVSDMEAFSPRLANYITLGHTGILVKQGESESKFNPLQGDSVVGTLGLVGVNPNAYAVMGFPALSISGITGLSMAYDGGYSKNIAQDDGIVSLEDAVTWSHGRHAVKLGAQYLHYRWRQGAVPQTVYGSFSFTGAFTGLAFADFLLGLPATSTRLSGRVDRKLHQSQSGAFLADSFRVTSRFTVDYGVRWDYYDTPVYDDGYMSNWDPASGQIVVAPGTLTAVNAFFPKSVAVVVGQPAPRAKTTNFRPRVAAAYRLSDNLVLRGGYGEYTENEGYGVNGRLNGNNPYSLTETYTNSITNGVAALTFPKPFPASPSSSLLPGESMTALPTRTDEGVIRQYNGTLEGATHGVGLRISYIGSRGAGMNYTLDINKPRASATPFATSRKPYPQFASTSVVRTDGRWRYNSVLAQAQRRAGPVTFDTSFSWANNLSNYANTTDPYNVTNQWTRDASDRRRYFVASAAWPLPAGKGHRLLSQAGPVTNLVLGNWTLYAITTFASGQYFSPWFTGPDPANASQGFVTQLPDCVGDPKSGAGTLTRWFNPAAFAVPPANAGRYGTCGMNTLEGYPVHVGHLSLGKRVPMGEQLKLVFDAQISNVTNTPHFTIPNNNISNPNPGIFTASSVVAGSIPERLGSRQIDFKLRLEW